MIVGKWVKLEVGTVLPPHGEKVLMLIDGEILYQEFKHRIDEHGDGRISPACDYFARIKLPKPIWPYEPFDGDFKEDDREIISEFATAFLGEKHTNSKEVALLWGTSVKDLIYVRCTEDGEEYYSYRKRLPLSWPPSRVERFFSRNAPIFIRPLKLCDHCKTKLGQPGAVAEAAASPKKED